MELRESQTSSGFLQSGAKSTDQHMQVDQQQHHLHDWQYNIQLNKIVFQEALGLQGEK